MVERLSPLDLNFWEMDTNTTHQAISSLCVFDSLPDFERIMERWNYIIDAFPKLRACASLKNPPSWKTNPNFSIDNHVSFVHIPNAKTVQDLYPTVANHFSKRLDPNLPQWKYSLFSNHTPEQTYESPSVAIGLFTIHHALADGLGGLTVINTICDSSPDATVTDLNEHLRLRARTLKFPIARPLTLQQKFRSVFRVLREALGTRGVSPLNGPNSSRRSFCTIDFDLNEIKAIKKYFNTTANDTLLAIVAGAARRFSLNKRKPLDNLKIIMPVTLRSATLRESLGNRLSGISVTLPVTEKDPEKRIKLTSKFVSNVIANGTHGAYAALGKLNSRLPKFMHRRICEMQAKKTNFICTNVPGNFRKQYTGGAQIEAHYALPALMREHGIAYAFLTYTGRVHISLVSDPTIVPDANDMMPLLQKEKDLLLKIAQA